MTDRQTQMHDRHAHIHLLTSITRRQPRPTPSPIRSEQDDEALIEQWILNGMRGKLVRPSPLSPLRIEPCHPDLDGTWKIHTTG